MATTKQDGTRTSGETKEDKSASVAANAVNEPSVPDTEVVKVAVEGEQPKADTGSPEAKLAKELKSKGVDEVRVWQDPAVELFYADMFKNGLHRLLSITKDQLEDKDIDAAATLYAQAGFKELDDRRENEATTDSSK